VEITSKSLHHANIVFVFEKNKFILPDNTALMAVYQGDLAAGAQFIDDPVLKTKVLDLPRLKTQIAIDLNRLRVEDFSQEEPENSNLINTALHIYQQLFIRWGYSTIIRIWFYSRRLIRGTIIVNCVTRRNDIKNALLVKP